ncbi:hypothetical protein HK103_004258 [Boothiomyces macroporosus]|uniref:Uncharacterized protein n=1 Tax=Boothiomyces macroporosus TaxID=261099 RepID=A0AAD5UJT0_9FUNG|nr:hypothetical protein HK103_004258 [Boothiomyces macroporosus]
MVGRYCYFRTKKNVVDYLVWLYKEPSLKEIQVVDKEVMESRTISQLAESIVNNLPSLPQTKEGQLDPKIDDMMMNLKIEDVQVEFDEMTVQEYMSELNQDIEEILFDDLLSNSLLSELKQDSFLGESIVDETLPLVFDESCTLTGTQTNNLLQQLLG